MCRIGQDSVSPRNYDDEPYEQAPSVLMDESHYAKFYCFGREVDKYYYSMTPYGALGSPASLGRSGDFLNFGQDTCLVRTSGVDCASSYKSHHTFHLYSNRFTSPLISGDAVKAAQNVGDVHGYASTAVVKPTHYQLGEDTYFTDVKWTEWDSHLAVGNVAMTSNTCTPDCATGGSSTEAAVLMLSRPMIVCDWLFFTEPRDQDSDRSDRQLFRIYSARRNGSVHRSCMWTSERRMIKGQRAYVRDLPTRATSVTGCLTLVGTPADEAPVGGREAAGAAPRAGRPPRRRC